MAQNYRVEHKYTNITYKDYAKCIFNSIFELQNGFMKTIPVLKESTCVSNGKRSYWYDAHVKYYLRDYRSSNTYNEIPLLENDILFEFHCNELISCGILSKYFGEHDENSLIEMYKVTLLKVKEQYDIAEELYSKKDMTLIGIQKMLNVIRILDEYCNVEHKPIDDLCKQSTISGIRDYIYDQYDLYKYLIIVRDNISDEELFALYDKYPGYKEYSDKATVQLPCMFGTNEHISFCKDFIYIVPFNKDHFLKRFHEVVNWYTRKECTYNYDNQKLTIVTHANIDQELLSLVNCSFHHMVERTESYVKQEYGLSWPKYTKRLALLKKLEQNEYVIYKRNGNNDELE